MVDHKRYTDDEIQSMNWQTRSRLVRSDPVTCVRFFDHRLQVFINDVLKSELHPIGKIIDSFVRIEFQHRGSPHAHILFWIENAPNINNNTVQQVTKFVDKYISCTDNVNTNCQPMLQLQQHKHSKTCRKGGKPICRFGFPKPPMKKTQLLKPIESDCTLENLNIMKQNYKRISQVLADCYKMTHGLNVSHNRFLSMVGVSEQEYIDAIRSSIKSPAIFLKRTPSAIRVNCYMKNLLETYGANHDMQFVTDPFACAVYIVAYMSKSQRGMSLLLDEACKEARQCGTDIRNQVRIIGNKFVNAVEVSAQEAAYLLLQLPITRSSRSVVFINTSPPEERTFLLKSKEKLQEMNPHDSDIECSNVIKRYSHRPKLLEQWNLADYVSMLTIEYPDNVEDNYSDDYIDDPTTHNTYIELSEHYDAEDCKINITLQSGIKIKTCHVPKVIRFVNYNKETDTENYYREKMLLYKPWRKEENLLGSFNTYKDSFMASASEINKFLQKYEPNKQLTSTELAIASQEYYEVDTFPPVAPATQQTEQEDCLQQPLQSFQYSFYKPQQESHRTSDISDEVGLVSSSQQTLQDMSRRISDELFLQGLSTLNLKQ
ncbi:hypothetical protein HOLleu_02958 [Holothuria leucospilota]|uniref:Helitron helicase-like domain-containing protein n=1 Tax=Holothuria leucospilota TaxID=206669 RepID=A0A9Q1CSG3_HOLLE|nr:hypothetical protein HOLleu_02958 [Holothuria leucospilota]